MGREREPTVLSHGDEDHVSPSRAAAACRRCAAGRGDRLGAAQDLGLTPPGYNMPPLRGWEGGMSRGIAP